MNKKEFVQKCLTVLLLGSFMLVIGCSSNPSKSSPQDTIETVLGLLFKVPDQKLNELLQNPDNMTVIGKDDESLSQSPESPTELEKYLRKKYKPYFTQIAYDRVTTLYVFPFQTAAYRNGYEMEIGSLDIKESEERSDEYDFTVNVILVKANEKTKIEITGFVNFNDKGKISSLKLLNGVSHLFGQ